MRRSRGVFTFLTPVQAGRGRASARGHHGTVKTSPGAGPGEETRKACRSHRLPLEVACSPLSHHYIKRTSPNRYEPHIPYRPHNATHAPANHALLKLRPKLNSPPHRNHGITVRR